jgi:SAM-dependent methyltransferase
MKLSDALDGYGTCTRELAVCVARLWPEHEQYLVQRFAGAARDSSVTEYVARSISRILGDRLEESVLNYRWTCQMMLAEEYAFRCSGHYRHSSFAEVQATVYTDSDFMNRYTDGLLLSQLMWSNHSAAIVCYYTDFLRRLRPDSTLLEIGPGHGLLLALAARRLRTPVTGWDVSGTSLAVTRRALGALGASATHLYQIDILRAPTSQSYDAVVASELLEHLDDPVTGLKGIRRIAHPGGYLFLNIPVNSPAPDHIYLWRTPEEVYDFVTSENLLIDSSWVFPMTGKTQQQARAGGLTMSCVMICRVPGDAPGGSVGR